jgi:hypothetical protein
MAKKSRRSNPSRTSTAARPGRPRSKPAGGARADSLTGRLRAVAGNATFREVGQATGTHPENARRYLSGGSVGLKFLKNFAKAYKVRADWLLEGIGQQSR